MRSKIKTFVILVPFLAGLLTQNALAGSAQTCATLPDNCHLTSDGVGECTAAFASFSGVVTDKCKYQAMIDTNHDPNQKLLAIVENPSMPPRNMPTFITCKPAKCLKSNSNQPSTGCHTLWIQDGPAMFQCITFPPQDEYPFQIPADN